MSHKVLVFVTLLINLCVSISAKEYYDVSPKRSTCKVLDSKLVYNFTCTTKLINHTMSVGTMELILQPTVVLTNVHIEIQLYRKFATSVRPFMVKLEQDFCDFVGKQNSSILYRYLPIDEMRSEGNFYDPCPVSGRRFSKNSKFNVEGLPEIIPDGEFRLDLKCYTLIGGKKRHFILSQYYTTVETKTALQWYATLLPLWTNCTNIKRQSNCYVEGYFKIIKGRLDLKHTKLGQMPIKAKRLLVEIHSYIKNKLSEYWLQIPKSRSTGRKIVRRKRKATNKKITKGSQRSAIREDSPELDDRTVQETWNGKPRRNMKSYFQSLCKIAKSTVSTFSGRKRGVKLNKSQSTIALRKVRKTMYAVNSNGTQPSSAKPSMPRGRFATIPSPTTVAPRKTRSSNEKFTDAPRAKRTAQSPDRSHDTQSSAKRKVTSKSRRIKQRTVHLDTVSKRTKS